jgi:acyl dehydratase
MVHRVDERWTMAYAAALGDVRPHYMDTTRPDGIVAHPLFSVCPEWPVIVASRRLSEQAGVSPSDLRMGVHASHDVTVHRLIKPGDVLATSLLTAGVINIEPGAMVSTRLRTVDGNGSPVATTRQDGIHLGVEAVGPDRPDPDLPAAIEGKERRGRPEVLTVELLAGAAHTYTECARIWNPIHTDKAVAVAAGLPDIILHGTANLAHGVSAVVAGRADGAPESVRRVSCRFAAMVELPSCLTIRIWKGNDTGSGLRTVPFEVLNGSGEPAVKDGLVVLER